MKCPPSNQSPKVKGELLAFPGICLSQFQNTEPATPEAGNNPTPSAPSSGRTALARPTRYKRPPRDRRPANWAAFNVMTAQDSLVRVLPWILIKSHPRPLGRAELTKAWAELAISAESRGLAPCLLYHSRQGRRLVRLPRWLNKVTDPAADQTMLSASKAMPLETAERLLRTISIDMHLLGRLWHKSETGITKRVPLASG